jgi:hypothetical protein
MFMNDTLIMAKMRLNLTNLRIEMYPMEGPILKAPLAPVEGHMLKTLVALDPLMVSCLKSQTTVGAGRCTQCRPSNVHWKVDEADPRKKGHYQEGNEDVLSGTSHRQERRVPSSCQLSTSDVCSLSVWVQCCDGF